MHNFRKIDRAGLRQFGLLVGSIIAVVFGILLPFLRHYTSPGWVWVVAAILISLALLAPSALRPVYRVWMRIGEIIGAIETRLILGIIFYSLLTPMGLVMRLLGHDPMQRKLTTNSNSYRQTSEVQSANGMENPY
ncbi:MAG: SxtJ family membrane protein [Leptolyngbyaceae cyanobacterium bins.349]|nr:SxtJ family membrane protein [Leptolyngbyaceae cyanobacterium bins.349]